MSQHNTGYVISYHGMLCHNMSYVTNIAASLLHTLDLVTEQDKVSVLIHLLHLPLQEIARAGNLLDELTREILQQV